MDEIIGLLFQFSIEIYDEVANVSKSRGTRLAAPQAKDEDLRLVVENFPHASAGLCARLAKAVTARLATLNKNAITSTVDEYKSETSSEISSTLSEYCPTSLVAFGNSKQLSKDEWKRPNFVCPLCSLRVKMTNERHWRCANPGQSGLLTNAYSLF